MQVAHTLLDYPLPPLELKGYTRGRNSNPLKQQEAIPPSRKPLNLKSKSEGLNLNLMMLKSKYRKYFGYFLA
jgi:hypothetical protein